MPFETTYYQLHKEERLEYQTKYNLKNITMRFIILNAF